MRCVIKRRRECSEPPLDSSSARVPASSFCPLRPPSEPSRRRASALPLRSHAVRFALFRRPAPLGATPGGYRSHASGYSLSLHRYALLWLRFRRRPRVRHTPPAPTTVGESARLCNLFHRRYPHMSEYEKGGRLPVPLMGSNSYSSKPCTTVSSVLESNTFAASVTGK